MIFYLWKFIELFFKIRLLIQAIARTPADTVVIMCQEGTAKEWISCEKSVKRAVVSAEVTYCIDIYLVHLKIDTFHFTCTSVLHYITSNSSHGHKDETRSVEQRGTSEYTCWEPHFHVYFQPMSWLASPEIDQSEWTWQTGLRSRD